MISGLLDPVTTSANGVPSLAQSIGINRRSVFFVFFEMIMNGHEG
jgi:hypothetical protein